MELYGKISIKNLLIFFLQKPIIKIFQKKKSMPKTHRNQYSYSLRDEFVFLLKKDFWRVFFFKKKTPLIKQLDRIYVILDMQKIYIVDYMDFLY
jgi:hypothetical protein